MSWSQQRWELTWQAVRDVLLTGTGIVLLLSQVFSRSPSDVLITAGLALTVPTLASHARIVLSGGSDGPPPPSSPSSSPSTRSPSGSSSSGDGDDEQP